MPTEHELSPDGEARAARASETAAAVESRAGTAVQWWLEKEAAKSTFNKNDYLDDLTTAREQLLAGDNPKQADHIRRIRLWLEELGNPSLRPDQNDELTARILFGGLMFLSGSYRRQRQMQASDQQDYLKRKIDWSDPHSAGVKSTVEQRLAANVGMSQPELLEAVRSGGEAGIAASTHAAEVIHQSGAGEFGKELSEPVTVMSEEQQVWLTFMADAVRLAMVERGDDFDAVPVLEHTTITEAKLVKLRDYQSGMISQHQ